MYLTETDQKLKKKSGRRERIRTSDPLVPNQLRYQAALLAVRMRIISWLLTTVKSDYSISYKIIIDLTKSATVISI